MGIGNDLIGDLEQLLVTRAVQRQTLFRMSGPTSQCWRAEAELEAMYEGARCLLLPSATIGLALTLELLDLAPGQEVLITPLGWLSNWSCIVRAGLVPRFLPLNEQLQLDPAEVAERITERTGAVIVTHLMGRGQQAVGAIASVCASRGVPLLEDIAQSLGVAVSGRRAGTYGVAAWCSLNHHKLLSTGDGGFMVVKDPALFERLMGLHDQGCVLSDGKRRPARALAPGLSLRATDLTGAVLRAQLARFHLIRQRIWALHHAVADACGRQLHARVLPPHAGDLPFTVLFERPSGMDYPSLAESGWHVAGNVPWLADTYRHAAAQDAAVSRTFRHLSNTGALGAGFIDPYYAIARGLRISDPPSLALTVMDTLARQADPAERTR